MRGLELHRLALYPYSYLHLPMVAGIVLFALGLKTTLGQLSDTLETVPAVGLCGGAALYLLGEIASLYRTTGRIFRRRTVGAAVLLALVPSPSFLALVALALVAAVCSLIVAYEVLRYREPESASDTPNSLAERTFDPYTGSRALGSGWWASEEVDAAEPSAHLQVGPSHGLAAMARPADFRAGEEAL